MLAQSGPSSASKLWAPDTTMQALLDSLPSAMAVADGHGQLLYCNPAWVALGTRASSYGELGTLVTAGDRVGTPYLRRLAALDGPLALPAHRLARAAQDALAGRSSGEARLPYRIRRPEGEEPFEALLVPLPTSAGNLLAIHHIDVGDRERAADIEAAALEKALAVEEAATRHRRMARRVTQLGRDLHTPITPVRLEIHLLKSGSLGPLTEAQQRALDVAHRNVGRWAEREEAFQGLPGQPASPPARLDLADLVLATVEARQTEALKQGIRLLAPARLPAITVHAPMDDVRDVLDRLLDHALSASPAESAVTVEVHAQDGQAKVAVLDSGPGLAARDLRNVFEPWGGKRPAPGVSLSLYAARLAIEKAGGRMVAECDGPGLGMTLGFSLPLLLGNGAEPAPAGSST